MSKVYFIADLHLGHANILKFEKAKRKGMTIEDHDQWLIDQWNSVVKPNDIVWVLGDVAFGADNLSKLSKMKGQKKLVMGNHDSYDTKEYLKYFVRVYGVVKYKGHWLSHVPMHPQHLRGKKNIHGHTHSYKLDDDRYYCVSVEHNEGKPISLEELIQKNTKPKPKSIWQSLKDFILYYVDI